MLAVTPYPNYRRFSIGHSPAVAQLAIGQGEAPRREASKHGPHAWVRTLCQRTKSCEEPSVEQGGMTPDVAFEVVKDVAPSARIEWPPMVVGKNALQEPTPLRSAAIRTQPELG